MPPPRELVHLEGNPGPLLVWEALSVCGNSICLQLKFPSLWTWTGFAPYTAASLENSKIKHEALSRHEDIQGTSVFQLLCKDWNLVIQQPAGQSQTHRMQQSWPCNEADSLICGHQRRRATSPLSDCLTDWWQKSVCERQNCVSSKSKMKCWLIFFAAWPTLKLLFDIWYKVVLGIWSVLHIENVNIRPRVFSKE